MENWHIYTLLTTYLKLTLSEQFRYVKKFFQRNVDNQKLLCYYAYRSTSIVLCLA